jgi:hypothetical protein
MNRILLVGVGGGGSLLVGPMKQFAKYQMGDPEVHVFDHDKYETSNLARQNISESDIGKNKANVMAERYGLVAHPYKFNKSNVSDMEIYNDIIISCADCHKARVDCLEVADETDSIAIICGNENISAEAYFYKPEWKGTKLDPRVYYPDLLERGEDRGHTINCQDERALTQEPQLVVANNNSAAFGLHLLYFWTTVTSDFDMDHAPYQISSSRNRFSVDKLKDAK